MDIKTVTSLADFKRKLKIGQKINTEQFVINPHTLDVINITCDKFKQIRSITKIDTVQFRINESYRSYPKVKDIVFLPDINAVRINDFYHDDQKTVKQYTIYTFINE